MATIRETAANSSNWDAPQGRDLTGDVSLSPSEGFALHMLLGTGASADVWGGKYQPKTRQGQPPYIPIPVAIKIFRATQNAAQDKVDAVNRRLIRESNAWLGLSHPYIQPYLGHCSGLGLTVGLVSPLCANGNILSYLNNKPEVNRLDLIREIASALNYLHSKDIDIIHADLHSNNVLIDDDGHARLTDFGRSKKVGEIGYNTAHVAGSTQHMAPELFPLIDMEDEEVDRLFSKEADVYAFAMVCFEILTSDAPFISYRASATWQLVPLICQGRRPKFTPKVQGLIDAKMWEVMVRCWAQLPMNRPTTAEVVTLLESQ